MSKENKNSLALWEGKTKSGNECLKGNVTIDGKKYYITAFRGDGEGKKPVISGYVNSVDKSGGVKQEAVKSSEVSDWGDMEADDDVPF